MPPLPIAIVGCGDFGAYMAGILAALPCFRVAAVCDPNRDCAAAASARFAVPSFETLEQCLAESETAAVGLFTPNDVHCQQAVLAASYGKHIFCEKPMATTLADCYRMVEAADRAAVRLMVGHKRRLRPQYQKVAEVVRSGELGRVLLVNITGLHYRDPHAWWGQGKQGGGLLAFSGVHDIDFLRHLCGEVTSVSARWPRPTYQVADFEDSMAVMMQFASGVVASLQVSNRYPFQTFRQAFNVQVVLERGGIFYDPHVFKVHVQAARGDVQSFEFDNEAGYEQAYREELTSFANWVQRGDEPVLTAWDGLRCVEIMEAARASAYTGQQVSLPLPPEGLPAPPFGLHHENH